MAELTKQESIKLLAINKFRISLASTQRSRNLTKRSSQNNSKTMSSSNRYSTTSPEPKYPQTQNFKKALQKIGALQRQDLRFTFEPEEEDHKTFRTRRIKSLKLKFFKHRIEKDASVPYDDQYIDEAALGCWTYGQNSTSKSVWKRYKQNLNMLNFDTLKLTSKKKVY